MLIDMKILLDEATKKGYCVPAPSVFNALTIETAFSRAVKVHSPVILNAGGPLDFEFLAETAKFYSRRNPEVPVALNLDHGDDFEQAMRAIRAGFTSVMLNKSSAPFEENIRETKEVVHAAHIVGVSVEAELGCVGFGRLSMMKIQIPSQSLKMWTFLYGKLAPTAWQSPSELPMATIKALQKLTLNGWMPFGLLPPFLLCFTAVPPQEKKT